MLNTRDFVMKLNTQCEYTKMSIPLEHLRLHQNDDLDMDS